MPQDPILTERHTQEGRQTTKKGGTEEPNRFRKELVDEPAVATTNGDAGDIEGGVTKTRSGPSILAPTLLPAGEDTQGDSRNQAAQNSCNMNHRDLKLQLGLQIQGTPTPRACCRHQSK